MYSLTFDHYTKFYQQKIHALKVVHYANEIVLEHDHDFYELIAVQTGNGFQVLDGQEIPLCPGQVFLIHPGQRHYYRDFTHLTLLSFIFNLEVLNLFMNDLMNINTFSQIVDTRNRISSKRLFLVNDLTMSQLNILVDKIIDETINRHPGFRSALTSLLLETVILIARNCQVMSSEQALGTSKLAPVLTYMEKNFRSHLSLKHLAAISGMSISNFRHYFKAKIGKAPIAYLQDLRIMKAKELLTSSSLSIGDIATQTGFSDTNYFSRTFSQLTGSSPRQYRKEDHGILHKPGQH